MKFGTINKIVFLGGGELMAESAIKLKESGHQVFVATSRRHARELIGDTGSSLEQILNAHYIDYVISDDVNSDRQVHDHIAIDVLALSFGAAWIFRSEFIGRFGGRLLNLHGARLPHDRGAGGFSWQILRSNRLGCCLIHQVDTGVDTGSIIKFREFIYPAWCRIPRDYHQVYHDENQKFLSEFFADVRAELDFQVIKQMEYLSLYWPRLSTLHHGYIDWSWKLRHIDKLICAFDDPYPGASTFVSGARVFLKKCFIDFSDGTFHPFQAGMIYRVADQAVYVATEDGTLVVQQICDEVGVSLLNTLRVGDRFFTPQTYLEEAKLFRATYTPAGLKL